MISTLRTLLAHYSCCLRLVVGSHLLHCLFNALLTHSDGVICPPCLNKLAKESIFVILRVTIVIDGNHIVSSRICGLLATTPFIDNEDFRVIF